MKEQLKLLRDRLQSLANEAESIYEQVNALFDEGYNEVIDTADDPDSEEAADAAAIWDQVFDEDSSLDFVISAIDAAIGES